MNLRKKRIALREPSSQVLELTAFIADYCFVVHGAYVFTIVVLDSKYSPPSLHCYCARIICEIRKLDRVPQYLPMHSACCSTLQKI